MLNIGWLGEGKPFPAGPISSEFRDALRQLCEMPILKHRGFHGCELCGLRSPYVGNGQIRVKDQAGQVFAAPTMVSQYVEIHEYQPSDVLIEAALNSIGTSADGLGKSNA
ncbi:DUF7919 family protein [Blastopirellula marina]|nr:hypothetical protein [Blastopirellula marina]